MSTNLLGRLGHPLKVYACKATLDVVVLPIREYERLFAVPSVPIVDATVRGMK